MEGIKSEISIWHGVGYENTLGLPFDFHNLL